MKELILYCSVIKYFKYITENWNIVKNLTYEHKLINFKFESKSIHSNI